MSGDGRWSVERRMARLRGKVPFLKPRPQWPPEALIDLAAGRDPGSIEITPELVEIAVDHRMGGLLWSWAMEGAPDSGPRAELAFRDLRTRAHLSRLWSLLEKCVAQLRDAGIDVASIKGPIAESRWYDKAGERPCSDIDLWLSPYQLDRAGDALRILQPDHPWADFFGELATRNKVQTVTLSVDGIEVDLHLDLLKTGLWMQDPFSIWDSTEWFALPDGNRVRTLDATATLLHFLIHLNKDRFQRLLGYADVARIVLGPLDWDRLWDLAKHEGLTTVVASTLDTVTRDLCLEPAQPSRPLGPSGVVWRFAWRRRIRLRGSEGRERFRYRQLLIPFLTQRDLRSARSAVARKFIPPAEVLAVTDSRQDSLLLSLVRRVQVRPSTYREVGSKT